MYKRHFAIEKPCIITSIWGIKMLRMDCTPFKSVVVDMFAILCVSTSCEGKPLAFSHSSTNGFISRSMNLFSAWKTREREVGMNRDLKPVERREAT